MNTEFLQKIKKQYRHGDPSHDWSHILRVINLCKKFSEELGGDLKILLPAAYLHDIVNVPKNSEYRSQASRLASEKAKKILTGMGYSDDEIAKIAQVIIEHSYSANISPSSLESAILQDADKLDGMGAIGVMRWTTCGTKMNADYYHLNDPWGEARELNDKMYLLDHFEKKLLRLYDRLNTEPGRREGRKRMDFFHSFLEQLKREI